MFFRVLLSSIHFAVSKNLVILCSVHSSIEADWRKENKFTLGLGSN